ncbi:arsenate reductase family protein [Algoriphagus sp. PAP.12]|jgi:arsenate reductase|uniref:arsenate reductase family protein n=1 Tax=Algoriphagus sp. PAP.12 TaxID=2996678 RepID=UPI00227C9E11|nr:ArsC/Spx/MgsR family protein [Algoriphagus sp. PAP.12]
MKTHHSELYFYHNSAQPINKQTRAYAHSVAKFIHEIDLVSQKMTATQWNQILLLLDLRPKDLLNRAHPDYQRLIAGKNWDHESWLNILVKYPYLIKAPIALYRRKAILCRTPSDILKLN